MMNHLCLFVYFQNSLVRPGDRNEILSWSSKNSGLSDFHISVNIPHLRVCVVNHQFLEVLYNRIVSVGFSNLTLISN